VILQEPQNISAASVELNTRARAAATTSTLDSSDPSSSMNPERVISQTI
jgi:hypothetical protein